MHITNYPSITQFQQHVELKDFRKPTKKEYVRYVRKLAEHFQCDPATLTEKPAPGVLPIPAPAQALQPKSHEDGQVCAALLLCRTPQSPVGSCSGRCASR